MKCAICQQEGAKIRHIGKTYGHGDELFVIDNVPVVSCPNCGNMYYEATTVKQLDDIKRNRAALAEKRTIEVVDFAAVPAEVAHDRVHTP